MILTYLLLIEIIFSYVYLLKHGSWLKHDHFLLVYQKFNICANNIINDEVRKTRKQNGKGEGKCMEWLILWGEKIQMAL